eukprot:scaffold12189_cov51-Attheya_sp.AAC.2
MGDVIVDVPGGSNNHNYANVTLIVELARLHGVHAVWAGWGHASENPVLPDTLAKSDPPIKFIGPSGPPMRALGDKIGSTIIAQSAGVPCIAWNGMHVHAQYDRATGQLPADAYEQGSIANATEASRAAEQIGFPIMIKASEGGGGKGIRMVDDPAQVQTAYRQVCGEVPGSPIFIMKLSTRSRHLEVQLLADEYGDAVALNGRDCSVQRRHQKIIEEGPPVAATPEAWKEMEKAAVSLAKAVSYANAGTVEYLYSEPDAKFYFLELNPRLQVEHPVTEMITKVNLPAAQLQVAMGIPLTNIPEIRELYGRNRFEDDPSAPESNIDFDVAERVPSNGHCIAVRITAENAEAGFKPTSGGIQELNFRSTPSVWGYFSMDSSGSIHEFADSQFGHLFASGLDREQARRNMVLALKELSIRGDISTTVDYISKLIELDDFVNNNIDTGWLDALIKQNETNNDIFAAGNGGDGDAQQTNMSSGAQEKALKQDLYVVIGATISAFDRCTSGESRFLELLEKGQLPSQSLMTQVHTVELILDGIKYILTCTRTGPHIFSIAMAGQEHTFVRTNIRLLSDGGYLIEIGGMSHVAYLTSKGGAATGVRLNIGGKNIVFSPDYDPTSLRTDVAGKLVKKLKPDGSHVRKGEPYGEIEVMKMFMPLKVEETGILNWTIIEGATLAPGDLLATLELDNPENVSTAVLFEGDMEVSGWGESFAPSNTKRPHLMFRKAIASLTGGMAGYVLTKDALQYAMETLHMAVTNPTLPVFEIDEQLSVLSGRMDPKLFHKISQMLGDFKTLCEDETNRGLQLRFPAEKIESLLTDHTAFIEDASEQSTFVALTTPLREAVAPYTKSHAAGVAGSERALNSFLDILRNWIAVEHWFADGISYADAVDNLRKANKSDCESVLQICRAHHQLESTSNIVMRIIEAIGDGSRVDAATSISAPIGKRISVVAGAESLASAVPCLSEIGVMKGNSAYSKVSLKSRKFLLQESLPDIEQRKERVLDVANGFVPGADGVVLNRELQTKKMNDLLSENIPMSDVLYPLLKSSTETSEEIGLLEVYVRLLYRTHIVKDFAGEFDNRLLKFTFMTKPGERVVSATTPVTSMTDMTRSISRSGSMNKLGSVPESDSEGNLLRLDNAEKVPPMTPRIGVCKIIEEVALIEDASMFETIMNSFPQFTNSAPKCQAGPINVLYFVVLKDTVEHDLESMNQVAKRIEQFLMPYHSLMEQADIRRVSFVFDHIPDVEMLQEYPLPAVFTYRVQSGYKEDSLFRHIEPNQAFHLDLTRLAENFSVRTLGIRYTNTCHVHLYKATPRPTALAKDRKANKAPRVFVRALSFVLEFSSASFERILVDALNALDLHPNESPSDNHLFINLVSHFEKVVLDPVVVEQVVVVILKRHGERVTRLGVSEVETRVVCCLSEDSPPISLRLVASNPTGYVHVMNTYVEAANETGTQGIFKLIGGTKASLAGSGDSSWEGMHVTSPYPLTRPFDAQRKAALRASDTLYCYDLPALFEAAVEEQWSIASSKGGVEGGIRGAARPLMVMYTSELVVQRKDGINKKWTMADYLNGDLELIQVQRGAGANDVGMVAWLMVLKTVEYPNGRQLVLIANDITHKAGSFGTREDVVFKLASEFAREKRIPRLYVAANSGARIGLAEGIKKTYKAAFKNASKPENGFDYLYLTKDDYQKLAVANKEVIAEPVQLNGEEVYKITDIIGAEPDLGVENLKGSGLIAGYQALNKLMGVDVYSTNDQLGGPGIMYSNGVSHIAAPDHLQAVMAAVDWLSYVPSSRGGMLPITDIRGLDEVERPIEFMPMPGVPYDPRLLIAGGEDDNGIWQSGFFDRDSFTETLAGWAKSVIVGRARLGGIPMGVIVTENRTAEAIKPADPADVKASEAVIQQAGCVWFPNSAYKTAQAINDFRTEDLPLMVFANWRGFSGGQRDMFDEVLKYGSLIVDAFVAYEQPVFVFIPPHAEIRGGAWVVLDASINASVMEMYASAGTARGGVLEANGAASVKYRTKDLLTTMHRLDETLIALDSQLQDGSESNRKEVADSISKREHALLPVYEQIAVQFCELHDTPGRMKAVGVIQQEVEWSSARSYFFWRLRRKLAEFDLRKKMIEAGEVGRGIKALTPIEASAMMKEWFLETPGMTDELWDDDKVMLSWMAQSNQDLEAKEVFRVITAGGNTSQVGTAGIMEGIAKACETMSPSNKETFKKMLKESLQL